MIKNIAEMLNILFCFYFQYGLNKLFIRTANQKPFKMEAKEYIKFYLPFNNKFVLEGKGKNIRRICRCV